MNLSTKQTGRRMLDQTFVKIFFSIRLLQNKNEFLQFINVRKDLRYLSLMSNARWCGWDVVVWRDFVEIGPKCYMRWKSSLWWWEELGIGNITYKQFYMAIRHTLHSMSIFNIQPFLVESFSLFFFLKAKRQRFRVSFFPFFLCLAS